MKIISVAGLILFVAGLLGLAASVIVPITYQGRAKLIQRVESSGAADALFDSAGTEVGSPEMLIIDDPKAFTGAKTESGAEIVSENYLREHSIYPLQMKSVRFAAGMTMFGSALSSFVGGIAFLVARRGLKPQKLG